MSFLETLASGSRAGANWSSSFDELILRRAQDEELGDGMGLSFRKASYEPGVEAFGNGCFAYLQPDGGWGFSNAGLVTDGKDALLIDTMFDVPHTRAMLEGFGKASDAKIGALVNTHRNGDHCYGNGCLDCEIIATERA